MARTSDTANPEEGNQSSKRRKINDTAPVQPAMSHIQQLNTTAAPPPPAASNQIAASKKLEAKLRKQKKTEAKLARVAQQGMSVAAQGRSGTGTASTANGVQANNVLDERYKRSLETVAAGIDIEVRMTIVQ